LKLIFSGVTENLNSFGLELAESAEAGYMLYTSRRITFLHKTR